MNLSKIPGIGSMFSNQRKGFDAASLVIALIIGGVFISFGYGMISAGWVDQSWTRVAGTIKEVDSNTSTDSETGRISTTHAPTVRYVVGQQEYTVSSTFYTSTLPSVGGSREIAYNPANPSEAKVVEDTSSSLLAYLFPAVGVIAIALALFSFMRNVKRGKAIRELETRGQKVRGVMVNLLTSGTRRANRVGSARIVVAATDLLGQPREFISDEISAPAALAVGDYVKNPLAIDVYLDTKDPKNFYVDLSDIPELTLERIQKVASQSIVNAQAEAMTPAPQGVVGTPPIVPVTPVVPVAPPSPAAPAPAPESTQPPIPPVPPVLPR